jgi:hypothetical protein
MRKDGDRSIKNCRQCSYSGFGGGLRGIVTCKKQNKKVRDLFIDENCDLPVVGIVESRAYKCYCENCADQILDDIYEVYSDIDGWHEFLINGRYLCEKCQGDQ